MEIHSASTIQWRGKAIASATDTLLPLFDEHRGEDQIRATWQGSYPTAPSPAIVAALTQMVHAVRGLGIPAGITLPVVPKLVSTFVETTRAMDGWKSQKGDATAQVVVDLGFLALVKGDKVEEDEVVQKLLKTVGFCGCTALTLSFRPPLPSLRTTSLQHSSNTFAGHSLHCTHSCCISRPQHLLPQQLPAEPSAVRLFSGLELPASQTEPPVWEQNSGAPLPLRAQGNALDCCPLWHRLKEVLRMHGDDCMLGM
jgi:hypothetical protein